VEDFFRKELDKRIEQSILRQLKPKNFSNNLIDFSSNDYLGFAKTLVEDIDCEDFQKIPIGSGGARLLNGNYPLLEELESKIAQLHHTEDALLFESGYQANLALFSAVLSRGFDVFYDKLCHASIKDGIRLSFSNKTSFLHNNWEDLESKIKLSEKPNIIVVESVYSMDGDSPDWNVLYQICEKYNAFLIVDEAHSAGIFGEKAEGITAHLPITKFIVAKTITFGKSFGISGAAILGSKLLKSFLLNYSRGFIYTTAMPPFKVFLIGKMYDKVIAAKQERKQLWENIEYFNEKKVEGLKLSSNKAPIQYVMFDNASETKKIASILNEQNILVYPIVYPTVQFGFERIRIILHSFNTKAQIDYLVGNLAKLIDL
jgi:8-amino-7-oxononanoate synthase